MSYRIMVLTSSPNKDGLTAACGKAVQSGRPPQARPST